MTFVDFIFNELFSGYFKENDSYKQIAIGDDANFPTGKGLLERYINCYESELDEDFTPFINNFINELAPLTVGVDRLNYLAYTLGNPPDILYDDDYYRKLLGFIVTIYKVKGTALSYTIFFGILGYEVTIIEYYTDDFLYDSGFFYDSDHPSTGEPLTWDEYCEPCSFYDLLIASFESDCEHPEDYEPIAQATLDAIQAILCFIEPINAKLKSLINTIPICEVLAVCSADNIDWETRDYFSWDDEDLIWDDDWTFDTYLVIDGDTILSGCQDGGPMLSGIGYMNIEGDFIVS